jgi:Flp pilus assembly protein TadG
MIHRSHLARRRRGTTIVEFAFVLSACVMFMLGTFEYGRFIMIRQLMTNAAREGARKASTGVSTLQTSDIQATVTAFLASQPLSNVSTQVYMSDATGNNVGAWNSAAFAQPIAVKITASYAPILPGMGFLQNSTNLSALAIVRSEGQ